MLQTTLCVPLDVKPESAGKLTALIEDMKRKEDKPETEGVENFARLIDGLPMLHFMSVSLFEDPAYDPIFIIEINIDGAPAPFWQKLEALLGEPMRDMLRCCKKPLDKRGNLYDAVTAPGSKLSVAPYLQAMTQAPSVFHHGNRGLSRDRILREAALFQCVRNALDGPDGGSFRGKDAVAIHQTLRERMLADFPEFKEEVPPRISVSERAADILRLLIFALAVLLVLSAPGMIAISLLNSSVYTLVCLCLGAVLLVICWNTNAAFTAKLRSGSFPWRIAIFLVLGWAFLTGLLALLGLAIGWVTDLIFGLGDSDEWVAAITHTVIWGQLGLFVVLPALVLWLRRLERRDASQEMARIDEAKVAAMLRREDWVTQNHMGSIVHVRPGVLRTFILRAGHLGLGLVLRVKATNGYLGSMRTVHFAHWAFLNNGSRLLFFSNFDQSWGSYLDDFIEKAHGGLTLAWGCGVGFPPTDFLVIGGAEHGRLFKNWALASRTVSRFWFSAYPGLSVDQVERNARIAEGLRKTTLEPEKASEWVREL